MSTLIVLCASVLVAFFLSSGLAHGRPEGLRALSVALAGAIAAPLAAGAIATLARGLDGDLVHFTAFAIGVILLGYMFLAGTWLLRYLADQMALRR